MKPKNPKKTTVVGRYCPDMPKPLQYMLCSNVSMIFSTMTAKEPMFALNIFKFWDSYPDVRNQAPHELLFLMDLFKEVYDLHDPKEMFKRLEITESEFIYWLQGITSGKHAAPGQNNISNS